MPVWRARQAPPLLRPAAGAFWKPLGPRGLCGCSMRAGGPVVCPARPVAPALAGGAHGAGLVPREAGGEGGAPNLLITLRGVPPEGERV